MNDKEANFYFKLLTVGVFELQDLKDVSVLIKLTGSLRGFLLNRIAYCVMYKGCKLQASGVSWYSLLYNLT